MCEAKVYMEKQGADELIMEDVVSIKPAANGLDLIDLFGEQKPVAATIKEIKLLEHVVLLTPLE
jgi:predicted RNA-binding protein